MTSSTPTTPTPTARRTDAQAQAPNTSTPTSSGSGGGGGDEAAENEAQVGAHSPGSIKRSNSLCKLTLTPAQIARRKALLKLSHATNLGLFHDSGDEDQHAEMRLSQRGVVFFAGASAVAYYLLRLVSRDLLGGFKWYRALAKQEDRKSVV